MRIIDRLKTSARNLKKRMTALYYAGKHPELPMGTRFLIAITIGYALSPIDLIPDFIPVLGYLDDLIILPLLIMLCIKAIPEQIMQEATEAAEEKPVSLKSSLKAALIIILIWLIVAAQIIFKVILS